MNASAPCRFVLLLLPLALAAPVAAEIYRCPGPDGNTIFTSDPKACANPQRHKLQRDVQIIEGPSTEAEAEAEAAPPAAAGSAPSAPNPADDATQEAHWRGKLAEAEKELKMLRGNVDDFKRIVNWCNRGGDLVVEQEDGNQSDYSCEDANENYEKVTERITELEGYLDEGLSDECRREGCLPGWIR